MQRNIDLELMILKKMIVEMGQSVEKAVEEATQALIEKKTERLDQVRLLENKINAFHLEVDEKCLKIIASQSPLAADLRLILAILKINSDLERMGDQAMNISYNVRDYLKRGSLPQAAKISDMAKNVRKMINDSLEAFLRGDVELSEKVLLQDDAVDAGKNQMFRDLIVEMKQDPNCVENALDLILISRNLERLGDHATNIAEDVIFASTGRDIRHGGYQPAE